MWGRTARPPSRVVSAVRPPAAVERRLQRRHAATLLDGLIGLDLVVVGGEAKPYLKVSSASCNQEDAAQRCNFVAGPGFITVRGMTMASGQLVYASADGSLKRVAFEGKPVGTPEVIGGPTVDGVDWTSRGFFAFN